MLVLVEKLELYSGDWLIFDMFGVEDEIGCVFDKQVLFKLGGYLVIDQIEVMIIIDVNIGLFLGQCNFEEMVFCINLEVVQVVVCQLWLCNLGGIIIIDFIDMDDVEYCCQVFCILEKVLVCDYVKIIVYEFLLLGLVEMICKCIVESLEWQLFEFCLECSGCGLIKIVEMVIYEIFCEIIWVVCQFDVVWLLVIVLIKVVVCIIDEEFLVVVELEEFLGKLICFQVDEQYLQEQFDVVLF